MELLFKNDCVNIFLVKEKQLLIQVWGKEYPEFVDFKDAIDKTVLYFRQYSLHKLLSDTRAQPLASYKNTDYAASVVPELIKLGMKKMAFVMSENPIVKHSVDSFEKEARPANIEYFSNIAEANAWLDL